MFEDIIFYIWRLIQFVAVLHFLMDLLSGKKLCMQLTCWIYPSTIFCIVVSKIRINDALQVKCYWNFAVDVALIIRCYLKFEVSITCCFGVIEASPRMLSNNEDLTYLYWYSNIKQNLLFFWSLDFGLSRLTSLQFIQCHVAGFY